ncbi:hypothetical protein MAHJHV57_50270 [Mycobacterium avium subsp. hominissuis]
MPSRSSRIAACAFCGRVREILHTLPQKAQAAILDDLEGTHKYRAHEVGD